jgi:hypothetical protein
MYVVNSLDAARAALAGGERALTSPYAAACHAGVNYYRAMLQQLRSEFPTIDFLFTLCCGADAAIAHDALRLGFTSVRCDCGDAVFTQLQSLAAACGATIQRA